MDAPSVRELSERSDYMLNVAHYMVAADWYIACLERVQSGESVAGLGEAKAGYDAALGRFRSK